MPKYQKPPGMHDILPEDFRWYEVVQRAFSRLADAYGFGRIETPVLEHEEVFSRGVGVATDIVEKQMYTLRTRGGDKLALRPEGTAGVVRAYVENGLKSWPQPVRLWYFSSMFRHERPQAGRRREFWQGGFEIIGEEDAVVDAEIVLVTTASLAEIGLKHFFTQVNSIGCSICRPLYRKALLGYLRSRQGSLCVNCRKRLKVNPLRVLDCKEERCSRIIQEAPETLDYLCEACRDHFRSFLEYVEEVGIPYVVNSRLVRGLDYYARTVFEVFPGSEAVEGAPDKPALASGGRYDPLLKLFAGKSGSGGVGSALGTERIIAALKEAGVQPPEPFAPQIFLAQLGDQAKRKAAALFEELRRARFRVRASFGRDSIKSQLRIADKLGSPIVLILGQKEVSENTVLLRFMATGKQETVKRDALVARLRERLRNLDERRTKTNE